MADEADQAAGKAVVFVLAVFGAHGDVTGRPAVVDDGKVAAAGQRAADDDDIIVVFVKTQVNSSFCV